MKSARRTEFGDFQTPLRLARDVCALLRGLGIDAERIVEPTCGVGAFLVAAVEFFPFARLAGFEIDPAHLAKADAALRAAGRSDAELREVDFFHHDWEQTLADGKRVLVLGNPPWVTQAAVAALDGSNVPRKENIYGLRGLAAKTGKANFDIAEWMLVRLLQALRGREATVAVLCKAATAQKVLQHAWRNDLRVGDAALYRIDAAAEFGVAVEACLFVAKLGRAGPAEARAYPTLAIGKHGTRFGLAGRGLVADLDTYERSKGFEGWCPYQWRSGVKHDCAPLLELVPGQVGEFANQSGETVRLEAEMVYPLLKSTELTRRGAQPSRAVLLPQRRLGEDTAELVRTAPLAWAYLEANRDRFAARKSSIYRKGPEFSIFGIGDYTFAPWKVAISALHRPPRFTVVGPWSGRPVVFDDTCYYLPFQDGDEADVVARILNSAPCQDFLSSLIFPGAKRAVTAELLQRLDLGAIAEAAGLRGEWVESRQPEPGANQFTLNLTEPAAPKPGNAA